MLRASSEQSGNDYDLNTISGEVQGDGGIPHGQLLVSFAEAILGDDEKLLDQVRGKVLQNMGEAAMIDAAAVAGLFNAIDRVADACGIPLEDAKAEASEDIRAELGVNDFVSVYNS